MRTKKQKQVCRHHRETSKTNIRQLQKPAVPWHAAEIKKEFEIVGQLLRTLDKISNKITWALGELETRWIIVSDDLHKRNGKAVKGGRR